MANGSTFLMFVQIFENSNLLNTYQNAVRCVLGFALKPEDILRCERYSSVQSHLKLIEGNCPEQFQLSSHPLFFGHVRFIYRADQLIVRDQLLLPNFICYDRTLCDFPDATSVYPIDGFTCRKPLEMRSIGNASITHDFFQEIYRVFSACSSSRNFSMRNRTDIERTRLYRCQNTWKYISKHRLVDGVRDCHEGDDEISPLIINTEKKISFRTICDQFVELKPILIHNVTVTDESDCAQWPCKNIYTECNGIWNCVDGSDENNCQCQGQLCVSLSTRQLMCLEQSKIHDGIPDCVGGSDERQYCRTVEKENPDQRFLCSTNAYRRDCLSIHSLCDTREDCALGEDENFCEHFGDYVHIGDTCDYRSMLHNLTEIEKFLCQLSDEHKSKLVHFALKPQHSLQTFSARSRTRTKRDAFIEEEELDRKLQRCYRGLPIQVDSDIKCLCPPAYYGHRCQYQSERISLTFKLQTFPPDWRTIFAIVITLIADQDGSIEFTEQLIYNHLVNCWNKFDVNLLYSTQPKDPSKTYSIRLDIYNKQTLVHRAGWLYPILSSVLPVYRLATELQISLADARVS